MASRKPHKAAVHAALDRLAGAERAFLEQEFLAPVLRGAGVQVRIASVRCQLKVEPGDFQGWGVFRPASHALARLLRPASMGERRRYLQLFPALSLVLVKQQPGGAATGAPAVWLAAPAGAGDARFRIAGMVPVHLAEDVDRFDTVRVRFDGSTFWFEESDPRADPGAAAYLRQSFLARTDPARVDRPGMTAEQRAAYALLLDDLRREEAEQRAREAERQRHEADRRAAAERQTAEGRVREALAHAGADLRDLSDRGDVFRVTYVVDGRRHTSVVGKNDLTVQTAGICLSGGDRNFDLHSLIGVIREGEGRGQIVRVGG